MATDHAADLRAALDDAVARVSAERGPLDLLDDVTVVDSFAADLATARVAGARAAGASWEDVARRLGVSRQAAHKRFRRRAGVGLVLRVER